MRIRVRGKLYESVDECAEALGVSRNTVYVGIHRDRPDSIGLGQGKRGAVSGFTYYGGRPKKPVMIAGLEFDSMRAASLALGLSPTTVQRVLAYSPPDSPRRENLVWRAIQLRELQDQQAAKARQNWHRKAPGTQQEEYA